MNPREEIPVKLANRILREASQTEKIKVQRLRQILRDHGVIPYPDLLADLMAEMNET